MKRKNIKKLVSGALVTTMLITGVPVGLYNNQYGNVFEKTAEASTENTYTVGNSTYTYQVLEDGTVEIIGYEGTDTELEIPSEIDGMKVTVIGDNAFWGCSSLKQIEIPVGVTIIGRYAFDGCSGLTQIEIPEGVTSIEYLAFYRCSGLAQIEIPEGVTSIGEFAFDGCSSLTAINVNENNKEYSSIDGVLFNKDYSEIIRYPEGKEKTVYEIPTSVTSIGWGAFGECSSLEQIEIPEGVTSIGEFAFDGCSSLEQIEIPEGVTSIGSATFQGCSSLTQIEISASVTSIGSFAFNGCSSLEQIEIPEGVTSIGEWAFEGCSSLTQIEIPVGVTSIGEAAFYRCSGLTQIEIPKSVTSIGEAAFYGCDLLTIYGYSGSYAEQYANQQGIPFISIISLKSDDNIVLEYPENMMGTDICLSTKLLIDEDDEYKNIILENKLVDSSINPSDVKFTAYDINLLDSNNNKVQPKGYVTVKIPCPNGYVGENCKVYRVNDDDTFTDMEVIYEDEMLVFKTNHFSKYIILITAPNYLPGDSDGDGEVTSADAVLMKKYLAGYSDLDISEEASDVDGDGEITSADAVLLLRYLAGYDVELK